MVIALLLAQLVLPGPPSGPIQPPGMICASGSCERGPMVYRTSASRSRLVVACDMTSATCSDGRQITTTRSTPVPCEVAPGQWEMVPAGTGCYSVRGLESWAGNTSYLSYGAQLDHALWTGVATVTKVGSVYRVCGETFGAYRQRLAQEEGGVVRTSACHVRAGTSNRIRFLSADITSGGVNYDYTLTGEWQTVIATATVREEGGVAGVRLHPATAGAGCIDVAGCWSVIGDTPGRACWDGAAPVHCDADRHTISTEGWPTEAGEINVTFQPGESPTSRYILDTRTKADGTGYGVNLYLTTNNVLVAGLCAGTCNNRNTSPIDWAAGLNHIRFRWSPTEAKVWVNGKEALAWEPTVVIESHHPEATLGSHRSGGGNHLNGSIRSLRIRSYEEVSP